MKNQKARSKRKVSRDLPPPEKRACVQVGVARVEGGKVRYEWTVIKALWALWPNASLTEFAATLDIPYLVLAKREWCSTSAKRQSLHDRGVGFRSRLLSQLSIPTDQAVSRDSETLSNTLSMFQQIATIGAVYAKTRMARIDGTNVRVNASMSPKDAKVFIEIALSSVKILEAVFAITDGTGIDGDDGSTTQPKMVPAPLAFPRKSA